LDQHEKVRHLSIQPLFFLKAKGVTCNLGLGGAGLIELTGISSLIYFSSLFSVPSHPAPAGWWGLGYRGPAVTHPRDEATIGIMALPF